MSKLKIIVAALCLAAFAQGQERMNLTLEECRQLAIEQNEDLKKSGNKLRQAELDKAIAFSNYLPKVDGSVSGIYVFPDMDISGMTLQLHGMYSAGISVSQPLYAGGKIMAANKLAKIGKEVASENHRKTRMQVIADADNAYWSLIAVSWKVRLLESYQAQMDALYARTATSVEAGMATKNDLLRITAKRSEINYQLQKAKNGENLCRLSLCHVVGCGFDTQIVPVDTVIPIAAPSQLDESIALRPELHLLQSQVDAAKQQIKVSRSEVLPTIGLMGGYNFYGNIKLKGMTQDANGHSTPFTSKIDDNLGLVMASISIPVFHWGEGLKKIRKAKLELHNAQLDLQKNSRLLSIEARQAVQNVTDGYTMVETARLGDEQGQENLRVMTQQYEAGLCTLTDLLDAQTQWQQAHSNLIEAQTQYKIYETEYLRVTGKL